MNVTPNFALENKKKTTSKEKENNNKEIEEELNHELNHSFEYLNEEMDLVSFKRHHLCMTLFW